jgi:hypothetical protein
LFRLAIDSCVNCALNLNAAFPFRRSMVPRDRTKHPTMHRASKTSQSQMLMLISMSGCRHIPLGSAAFARRQPLASKHSYHMQMARSTGQKQKPIMLLRSKQMELNKLPRKLLVHL